MEVGGHFALATIYLGLRYKTDGDRIKRLAEAILTKASGFERRMLDSPRGNRLILVAFNIADAGGHARLVRRLLRAADERVGPARIFAWDG